jgi:quercetin dioxygenase-like cupin family protein
MRVPYVRIVDGPGGGTRFDDAAETLELADFAPPAPPLGVSAASPAASVAFVGAPAGWDSPPHPAPRRQWVVMLRGAVEASTSDGGTRIFGPGVAVLLEDTDPLGAGHRTRVVGDTDWLAMVVVAPESGAESGAESAAE